MNKMNLIIIAIALSLISCITQTENKNSVNNTTPSIIEDTLSADTIIAQYPDISKEHLLGKYQPDKDSLFVNVPQKYCLLRVEYIHKDVIKPFIAMYEAAAKEGVNLGIISAVRTFDVQKWLWNQRYYSSSNPKSVAKYVLNYLAMPGTSRHHWGTDVDMMSTKLNYFETEQGRKSYQWLVDHAAEFGFYQVYTSGRAKGYNEEKWHWSYMQVAKEFQKQYRQKITYDDIFGFNGAETAKELMVIEDYVFGIDSICLE